MHTLFKSVDSLEYDEVMHTVGDAMCIVDSNMNFVGFNKRFVELYELPADKLLGLNPFSIYPEFKKSVFYEAFEYTIKTGMESTRIGYSNKLGTWIVSRGFKHSDNRFIAVSHVLSNGFNRVGYVHNFDSLTSLKNRHSLDSDINSLMSNGVTFGIILVDIKRFRCINELHGLEFGDLCLMEVAARIKGTLTANGQIFRLNADQFVILITSDKKDSIEQIKNIQDAFKSKFIINGESHVLTVNIGFYYVQNPLETVNEVINNVESALTQAKQSRCLFFEYNESISHLKDKMNMANELRRAMKEGEFELYYQAQIDTINTKICGFEALIRWKHPVKGLLTPGAFLGIAEEFDLIEDLDKLVIVNAFKDQKVFLDRNIKVPISINLSVQSLSNLDIISFIDIARNKYNVITEGFTIELTENALVDEIIGKDVISQLSKRGFKLAIDDFGTGYSSFRYLIQYPSNYLKIDRSFIHGFCNHPNLQTVVSNMIKMAHSLGILVVAEGVETMDEVKLLQSFECDFIQGFVFARPENKEDLMKRIELKGLSTIKSSLS